MLMEYALQSIGHVRPKVMRHPNPLAAIRRFAELPPYRLGFFGPLNHRVITDMALGHENLGHVALRSLMQKRFRLALNKSSPLSANLFQESPVIVAGFNHLADSWRPFKTTLNTRARVANVGNNLVWVLLEHGTKRDFKTLRIGILVSPICGEDGQLAAQNQSSPTVRARQAHDGLRL